MSHLISVTPEFYDRAVSDEIIAEIKEEVNSSQRSDEELLKEIFKVQYEQFQSMISSQKQLATVVTLLQPEVPKLSQVQNVHHCFRCAYTGKSSKRRR